MTTEELMKPRYKVIADYPNSEFKVGQIITMLRKTDRFPLLGDNNAEDWETFIEGKDGGGTISSIKKFKPYPHLFKPLQWWEEREEKDMPEYVGYMAMAGSTEIILKVKKHFSDSNGNRNERGFIAQNVRHNIEMYHSYSKSRIATEQEYLNQNSKQ